MYTLEDVMYLRLYPNGKEAIAVASPEKLLFSLNSSTGLIQIGEDVGQEDLTLLVLALFQTTMNYMELINSLYEDLDKLRKT